ncbi:hypothetical protein RclHR1_01510003 [Rhizophagus clarus]|uniref:Protein kinase domain-containing protein n=1 Tax=Rhizophagus clarus TaxID=94130 RepID=A0A2Z6QIL8_9GLOM|nr:hypothetical protein RclHR1_01510003 [Rhizophagus clarus]
MMVLSCLGYNNIFNAIHFQENFEYWTSGNDDINKFIQDTQLSAYNDMKEVLEWIPYDKFNNIKYSAERKAYRANWIDGFINEWDEFSQSWKRLDQNMFVTLKRLNNSKNIKLEFINEINRPYGITQDPQTKNYMMVLSDKCKKCDYICNAMHFQQNFEYWSSGNDNINKFIQNIQLSAHNDTKEVLEWIPYDKFNNIKYSAEKKVYRANWIDGFISEWGEFSQSWERLDQNMFVTLKRLNNSKNIKLEFINEINRPYGITQDPETKIYMMVLSDKCKKCNHTCNTMHFQQNFESWSSGNDDIDEFIQNTQLSAHDDTKEVLEWIPYNRFNNITYFAGKKVYKANWIDGNILHWNDENQNWIRLDQNMFVTLKRLNVSENIALKFINEINSPCGITQNPQTKNYMMVLSDKCKKCNYICNAMHFQQNFESWTSSNNEIDKFIQNTQLSAHLDTNKVLEWIPYDRFYDVNYIASGGFSKVYKAIWIDKDIPVALKILNNSKNITLEFMNEITLHNRFDNSENINYIVKFYGITQNPETKDYIMVLKYAEDGSLRNYLNANYNKLNWNKMINYLFKIALGLTWIHNNGFIHRDFHSGNILLSIFSVFIADMGLCKPADCNTYKNAKNNVYGVLPYVAPEILRGQNYTKASDIYSFGIIMYEIISGLPPYHNISHDENLAINICKGLRPRFNTKVPQLIVQMIKRCLDADLLNRPKAEEIKDILYNWQYNGGDSQSAELQRQIEEADIINDNLSKNNVPQTNLGISYNTHSEAIYMSRLLSFNNLPKPKNFDDYYECSDNIISIKSSASLLQINASRLNIDDNNLELLNNTDENNESLEYSESLQIDISQLNTDENEKL